MKNKTGNYYQRGSVSALAIMAILFFVVVIAAIMPMTNTEMKFAATNRNEAEARYAAEAGAKRAIVEMLSEQTNWGWLEGTKGATDKKQIFIDGKSDSDYYYSVYIETVETTPVRLTSKPVLGQKYKIISTGYVNGSKKIVSVIYKMNAAGSIPTSAVYVAGNFSAGQALEVTGEIVAGGNIADNVTATLGKKGNVSGITVPKYDFDEYKKDAVPLPGLFDKGTTTDGLKNYSLPKKAEDIKLSQTAATKYYVDGNLSIEENGIIISAIEPYSAVIFVKGKLDILAQNPEFKGRIMLITGSTTVAEINSTNFENVVIVSAGNVEFKNSTNIVGILAIGGDLYFKAGNTTVTGNEALAEEFNNMMGGYETGAGGTTAGEAEITNWKIE